VRLANDVGAEDVPEEIQFRLTWRGALRRDPKDRAVALAEADRAVRVDRRVRQVALLILDDRQLADLGLERGIGWESLVEPGPDLVGDQLAPDGEDPGDELIPADRPDRSEETGRERVIVRGKGDLGVRGHVVQMTRAANTVADRPSVDEACRLEGT
jgi:uncharacterized protein YjiS (DUF1127 family)